MKRALAFILAMCVFVSVQSRAQWIPNHEVNATDDASSYDLGDKSFMLDYLDTYFYCMYPQWTNHIYSWSRSGSGWNGDYQSQEEKWCLPLWNSFATPGYNWMLANDNEGLVSNTTYSAWQLVKVGPPLFFNGFAQTNEGIATVGVTNMPLGRIPHDSSDGDAGAIAGNLGSMQAAADSGTPVIDLWHALWNNGWNTDVVGARILGFSAGSHPFAPGGLATAVQILLGLNVETNVGTLTFDWGAAKAYTNHVVASGISVVGGTLTATVHFDRMPMAWDSPDGTITNNATPAFVAMPSIGNAFNWIIQVTNLPPGNYEIDVDGHFADSCTAGQLAAGRNWATNCVPTNPLWLQRASVLARKREQKGADPVTLATHSAGVNGVIPGVGDTINYQSHAALFYDTDGHRGATYISDIAPQVSDIRQYDVAIHNAAVQTNHTFTIIRITNPVIIGQETQVLLPSPAYNYRVIGNWPDSNSLQQFNPPVFKWVYDETIEKTVQPDVRLFRFQLSTNAVPFSSTYWNLTCSNNFYNFLPPITNSDGTPYLGTCFWRIGYCDTNFNLITWGQTNIFHLSPMATNWDRSMLANTNYLLGIATNHPHMYFTTTNIADLGAWLRVAGHMDFHSQSYSSITNQVVTFYQKQIWWTTNSLITNSPQSTVLSAINGAANCAWAYYASGSNAMFDLTRACSNLDLAATAFQQHNWDFIDAYNVDPGAEQYLSLAYDWLYPFMTSNQRSNVEYEIRSLVLYGVYGGCFYGDVFHFTPTNRNYPVYPFQAPYYSIFKLGTSHGRHQVPVGATGCIATMGEDPVTLGFFPMFANYSIFQEDPYLGDEGRGYAEQDGFKFDREWAAGTLCIIQFPEAKLWMNPLLTNMSHFFAAWQPAGYRGVFENWGDLSFGFQSQMYHYRYHDLANFTQDGALLRQYNRQYNSFRVSGADEFPTLGEAFVNYYFPKPTEADGTNTAYFDPTRGWVISSSLPPTDFGAFTNGVTMIGMARPGGKNADHGSYPDGQWELDAFGANCTGGGAANGYAKHPMYYNTILVNGIGTRTEISPPSDPVYSYFPNYTNCPAYTYAAADITLAFNRTNFIQGGLGDQTQTFYSQATNTVPQVTKIRRHALFPHKRYLVLYDECQTSTNAYFQWLWHIAQTNSIVDTSGCSFSYQCTNDYIGTNSLSFFQGGGTIVTNGSFDWNSVAHQYSNAVTGALIKNDGKFWNLFDSPGGTILYSSTNGFLLTNSWTIAGGSSPNPASQFAKFVTVYVYPFSNPTSMGLLNEYGTNLSKFNPFTKENRMGLDGDTGPFNSSVIWITNRVATTNFHFGFLIYPCRWDETPPTFTRFSDFSMILSNSVLNDGISWGETNATISAVVDPTNYFILNTLNATTNISGGGGGGGGGPVVTPPPVYVPALLSELDERDDAPARFLTVSQIQDSLPSAYQSPIQIPELEQRGPLRTWNLNWPASTDPTAAGYVVKASPEINGYYAQLTNTLATNVTITSNRWHEFFRVLAVNHDGLNSDGFYEN